MAAQTLQIESLGQFYIYYLTQHLNPISRTLHFIGTGLVIVVFLAGLVTGQWYFFALMPVLGYGFAWFGHFAFEKNKPAAFRSPLWSLASDFIMFWHIVSGQIAAKLAEARRTYPEYCN
jgi:hypothetical protein